MIAKLLFVVHLRNVTFPNATLRTRMYLNSETQHIKAFVQLFGLSLPEALFFWVWDKCSNTSDWDFMLVVCKLPPFSILGSNCNNAQSDEGCTFKYLYLVFSYCIEIKMEKEKSPRRRPVSSYSFNIWEKTWFPHRKRKPRNVHIRQKLVDVSGLYTLFIVEGGYRFKSHWRHV